MWFGVFCGDLGCFNGPLLGSFYLVMDFIKMKEEKRKINKEETIPKVS